MIHSAQEKFQDAVASLNEMHDARSSGDKRTFKRRLSSFLSEVRAVYGHLDYDDNELSHEYHGWSKNKQENYEKWFDNQVSNRLYEEGNLDYYFRQKRNLDQHESYPTTSHADSTANDYTPWVDDPIDFSITFRGGQETHRYFFSDKPKGREPTPICDLCEELLETVETIVTEANHRFVRND